MGDEDTSCPGAFSARSRRPRCCCRLPPSRPRRKCRAARICNPAATRRCRATGWSRPAVREDGRLEPDRAEQYRPVRRRYLQLGRASGLRHPWRRLQCRQQPRRPRARPRLARGRWRAERTEWSGSRRLGPWAWRSRPRLGTGPLRTLIRRPREEDEPRPSPIGANLSQLMDIAVISRAVNEMEGLPGLKA